VQNPDATNQKLTGYQLLVFRVWKSYCFIISA